MKATLRLLALFAALTLPAHADPYVWGDNTEGQFGNGTDVSSDMPVAVITGGVLEGKTLNAVAAGGVHSVALTSEGKVYAWGNNGNGQIGDGTTIARNVPVAVATGGVLAGKTVTAIAAGYYHTVALTADGKVYAWGLNDRGQLGDGTTADRITPIMADFGSVGGDKTFIAISAGASHTAALTNDGKVYAWGSNADGQLGDGTTADRHTPVAVNMAGALAGKTVTAIEAGWYHTVALTTVGKVYAWGGNGSGALGDGTTVQHTTPVAVDATGVLAGKTVTAISGGALNTAALTSEGKAYAWGYNNFGQLGDGTVTDRPAPVAVNMAGVLAGKSLTAIDASVYHTVALTSEGRLHAWGYNGESALGDGTHIDRYTPVAVDMTEALAGRAASQVTAGIYHNLTLAAVPTLLQQWKLAHLGDINASDMGDPDHDGLLTIAEYGLALLPGTPSLAPAMDGYDYAEGRRLRMILQRDPSHNDVTVEVEAAGALAGPWTTVATSTLGAAFTGPGYVGGESATPGVKTVEVRDTVNVTAASKRFMRVRVTR